MGAVQETGPTSYDDYPSHFSTVLGSKIHYVEQGAGDPVLFIHGIPTYSYVWRNILPALSDHARCIALDLIGMGFSDKPDITYSVFDHIKYLEGFIQTLNLKNLILVMHGWGSVVGFNYAAKHPSNVRGLAFFESHIRPSTDWDMLSLPVQQLASLLNRPGASYRAIVEQNYLIDKLLPSGVLRTLTKEEMAHYARPFPTPISRKPLWQYVQELPLGQEDSPVIRSIANYSRWLQASALPKLMIYAVPGFITTMETVAWGKRHLKNLSLVELPDALHFAQETAPEKFREILRTWYAQHFSNR